jgi:hypothetical protein
MDARVATPLWLPAALLLAAGCTVEADCRTGIERLQPRIDGAIGTGAHTEANEQISQAYTDLGLARELAQAGDFEGCLARLESARVLLNKSQRTNQQ